MTPRYPIFIPSKGRWDNILTPAALDRIGVPYRVVVEADEYDRYAAAIDPARILTIPTHHSGLVVTRNLIWDYAMHSGAPRFWTMDDNIIDFYRYNRNLKVPIGTGAGLCAIEDFVERYANVPIAGMQYHMFVARKSLLPPFVANTRVYSNMLIETNARCPRGRPYRNEGFYNDDTDLCLRVLKDGFCTILFNAFLIDKANTMSMKGGMTPHYQDDGRWKMADELRRKHPDVVTVVRKWGRWQHQVNYRPFKKNRLIRRAGLEVEPGVNNYGMVRVSV